jgi:hypothetical protein
VAYEATRPWSNTLSLESDRDQEGPTKGHPQAALRRHPTVDMNREHKNLEKLWDGVIALECRMSSCENLEISELKMSINTYLMPVISALSDTYEMKRSAYVLFPDCMSAPWSKVETIWRIGVCWERMDNAG